MKAHYSAGPINFEIDADSVKQMFKKIAIIQETFASDQNCGACGSIDICFQTRAVDDFEFFELACRACNARLSFGQHKKGGTLFAKRRDEDGHELADRGWIVFKPKNSSSAVPPQNARNDKKDEIDNDDLPF